MVIDAEENGKIELCSTDYITGEGTDDLRIDIITEYCSAWINLPEEKVIELRDELNKFIDN